MKKLFVTAAVLALVLPASAGPGELLQTVVSSGASVRSGPMPTGTSVVYRCDKDVYLKFGNSTVEATAASAPYVATSAPPMWKTCIRGGSNYLAVLFVGVGSATCQVWEDVGEGPCT